MGKVLHRHKIGVVQILLQQIINGLLVGGTYALIGGGFSLVYGVMSIINLAHGSLVMLGAYVTYFIFTRTDIDPFLTIPLAIAVVALLGYIFQITVGNKGTKYQLSMIVILTYGLDLILINVVMLLFSGDFRSVSPAYVMNSLKLGNLIIPYVRLAVFIVAGCVTGLLFFILNRTKMGVAVRATSLNKDAAMLAGMRTDRVYAFTFAVGAALAAVAGSLLSMVEAFTPFMGTQLLGKAFAVAVIGGLGNVVGAIFGGLVLGVAEGLGALLFGVQFQKTISFAVLLLILIFKPEGLMGRRFYS